MFNRISIDNDTQWHKVRGAHLQASEAASALDCSPWMTSPELYDEKVGAVKRKDIGDKPYVRYGKRMEPLIRAQVEVEFPCFRIDYHEYDILESVERPWQGCTLDGELEVVSENPWNLPIGAKGVLEIKTGSFRRESDLDEWNDGIPQHYYCQVIHQLAVTGYRFAIVVARLKRDAFKDSDNGFPEIVQRCAYIDATTKEVKDDIKALNEEEAVFWKRVQERKRPPIKVWL